MVCEHCYNPQGEIRPYRHRGKLVWLCERCGEYLMGCEWCDNEATKTYRGGIMGRLVMQLCDKCYTEKLRQDDALFELSPPPRIREEDE